MCLWPAVTGAALGTHLALVIFLALGGVGDTTWTERVDRRVLLEVRLMALSLDLIVCEERDVWVEDHVLRVEFRESVFFELLVDAASIEEARL